ncbi:DNA polymerase alpha catalytic subunit [Aphidius gifuensis]|nr:DNA polymerase alpha catalytic subunit [Aphidius gifuensis]
MIRKSKTQNSSCINNNNKSTNCSIKSSTIDNSSLLDNNEFEKLVASIDQDKLYAQMINKNSKKMNKIVDEKMTANEEKINIPLIKNNEGEMLLRFYWLDAIEDPQNKPGVVTLFGKIYINKTKTYESCCVIVKNIPRRIYCLPREKVKKNKLNDNEYENNTMEKVYEEWNAEATKRRITNYRCKKILKNYAFDREGTPLQSEYLEVRYPAEFPPIESTYSGETIEHIFNTTVNPLELFLIEREIKGPCWLEIKSPIQTDNFNTWSKYQVNCLKMENINVYNSNDNNNNLNIPYVSMATMNIRTTLNSKTQQNEITMIGLLSNKNYHIDKPPLRPPFDNHCCFVTRPKDTQWPLYARDKIKKFQETTIIFCETEIELLEKFLDKYQSIDPDFIIGYDCGFQFDVLIRRLTNLKIKNWMRTSKLKGTFNVFINGKVNLSRSFCGRAICDVQTAAKEVNLKVRNYDLDTLCSTVLKTKTNTIIDIKPCDCPNFYNEIIKIIGLIKITMMEVNYILSLICEMNIIPLALQITCIAGNVLSRTLNAGRSERNEYLLLHAFHKKDYITPDRKLNIKSSNANSSKAKSAYIGGLVLEPQRGFYDQLVLLMDFNSLYPSIIQEYNLCFSTIPGICYRDNIDPIKDLPNDDVEFGIVPTQIRKLVESRREVKKLLKTPNLTAELKMQYNIRQLALKLTANSMYGCLGASHCRFYAKHLAALVTTKGRDILQNTKALVEKLNYQVIYGDTDSIMINSKIINYDEAYGIAKKIKIEVNKLYKQIELDIDGLFKYMLLLNKKKYAAVSINKLPNGKYQYETEIKGLDVVRRDWCQLACDTGKKIIDHIFMDLTIEEKTCKIRELLNQIANDVNNNKLPLSSYVITKQLSKNPKDYPDNKQPHVAIALRLNKEGGRMWKKDDTVPYIICLDTTTRTPTERAYHIDEFKKNDELKIDIDYYLSCQIIPVAERITQPIPELDGGFLAESLGIKNYKSKNTAKMNQAINNNDDDDNNTDEDDLKKYENCESFKFTCRNTTCGAVNEVRSFMREDNVGLKKPVMLECINKKCKLPPWKYVDVIKNDLQTTIRLKIQRYYGPTIQCQNTECLKICKRFGIGNADKSPTCIKCQKVGMIQEYTAADFYNQLEFYEQLFNSSKEDSTKDQRQLKLNYPVEMINACNSLNQFVENYLKHNAYTAINFDSLYFFTKKKCWDPSSYQKAV